jgi:NTP pyrophosphatase (non-canonical NTP hydrolase)
MTNKEYQVWAQTKDRTTEGYRNHIENMFTGSKGRLINGALGLGGECGEVVDIIKKHTQYNKELNIDHLKEELGDILWYMAIILEDIGSSFDEVMQLNQNKLNKRFPTSFSEIEANQRKDKND